MESGYSGECDVIEQLIEDALTVLIVRVPREPQEVHSRHEDGVRWPEEGQGQERPDHPLAGRDEVDDDRATPPSPPLDTATHRPISLDLDL